MKISKTRLELAMAQSCKNPFQLAKEAGCQYQTLRNAINGGNCKPATIGKIAAVLNVPVELLVQTESGEGK